MKSKVLIVEDDGIIYETIRNELDSDFETTQASSYAAAIGRWEREKESFDCIVLDLLINPLGLELKEIDEYTPLFGMAVLDAFTKEKSKEEMLQIRKKTIIYSGYTRELCDRDFDTKNLEIIAKEGNSIKELIERIKAICSKY